jgi:capsular exopolysaccharide synthesis family protein
MERLKAALDKAREARGGAATEAPGRAGQAAQSGPAAKGTPLAAARGRAARAASLAPDAAVAEAWRAIPKLEIDSRKLARRRLISLARGSEAAAFDVLRTKVLQLAGVNGWRRVAITSPLPGSGKTTTSLNLAFALARQVDLRIILIDLDMRRPAIARTLSVGGKGGVGAILDGRSTFGEAARRHGDNLAIAMNYRGLRDPSDLFLRSRTAEVIDEIERVYRPDLVLFDMPPMLVNDDTAAFLGNVDCALIVAEADQSTTEQVDICEKELAEQTNVLGVVLNKCRFMSDSYSGYYHYDYS